MDDFLLKIPGGCVSRAGGAGDEGPGGCLQGILGRNSHQAKEHLIGGVPIWEQGGIKGEAKRGVVVGE